LLISTRPHANTHTHTHTCTQRERVYKLNVKARNEDTMNVAAMYVDKIVSRQNACRQNDYMLMTASKMIVKVMDDKMIVYKMTFDKMT